jgi:hypothetical protein
MLMAALAMLTVVPGGVPAAVAADAWADQTFLSNYDKLQLVEGREGRDYVYLREVDPERMGLFRKALIDQPEVFISTESPYKGAKPADLAAIATVVRGSVASALQSRGYTPVGFVVSSGVQALQDFTDKYEIRDMALQVEVQHSVRHALLGAGVVQRGKSADASKPMSFETLHALLTEYGERTACRLDNSHVTADRRNDCHDKAARQQRPRVLGP